MPICLNKSLHITTVSTTWMDSFRRSLISWMTYRKLFISQFHTALIFSYVTMDPWWKSRALISSICLMHSSLALIPRTTFWTTALLFSKSWISLARMELACFGAKVLMSSMNLTLHWFQIDWSLPVMDGYVVLIPILLKICPERDEWLLSNVVIWININDRCLLCCLVCGMNLLNSYTSWYTLMSALRNSGSQALSHTLSCRLRRIL